MTLRRVTSISLLLASSALACGSDVIDGTGGASSGSRGASSGATSSGASSSGTSGTSGTYEDPNNPQEKRPPPIVTSVTPLEGDYGTEVTVTGDNFDDPTANLTLGAALQPLVYAMPPAGTASSPANVITKWSKTEIKFRYPFPADGSVGVASKSGSAQGGTFVPSWKPGPPLAGDFSRQPLMAVVSPAAGVTVAAFDGSTGPILVVAKADGSLESRAYDRGPKSILSMSLYVTPAGTVDGFFSSGGMLWKLTDGMGAATTASTGVAAAFAAGGHDATGPYAWIKNGATLSRVRPPSWTADKTIADPTPSNASGQTIAVSPDNALYVGWGVADGGSFPFYDQTSAPYARRLRDGQSVFDGAQKIGYGADDLMIWTRLRPGPDGRVSSYYCANDTGLFESPTVDCGEGYVGNGVPIPSSSEVSEYVVGYNQTTAFVSACEVATAKLRVGPEAQTAQQAPALFPCPSLKTIAVSVDPLGAGHVLVKANNVLYAPRKR